MLSILLQRYSSYMEVIGFKAGKHRWCSIINFNVITNYIAHENRVLGIRIVKLYTVHIGACNCNAVYTWKDPSIENASNDAWAFYLRFSDCTPNVHLIFCLLLLLPCMIVQKANQSSNQLKIYVHVSNHWSEQSWTVTVCTSSQVSQGRKKP